MACCDMLTGGDVSEQCPSEGCRCIQLVIKGGKDGGGWAMTQRERGWKDV